MIMRKKPLRGEKYRLKNGDEVTALETIEKDYVKVITMDGTLSSVRKTDLELPIINTQFYEKIHEI